MSTRLKETGFLKFKDIDIDLDSLGIKNENVHLLQMNPENPDEHKISKCDILLLDGYSIKKGTLKDVLTKSTKLLEENAIVVVLSVSGLNEM